MKDRLALLLSLLTVSARADIVEFSDGTVWPNCYARDEGVRFAIWKDLADVGKAPKYFRREQIKSFKLQRDENWDARPNEPDLSVTFIEITPKLAGLHGKVDYDQYGRPTIGGNPNPEEAVKNLKLKYRPGEELTLTANVSNTGFANSQAFSYEWMIDGKRVAAGKYTRSLRELERTQFQTKYKWLEGKHTVSFRIFPKGKEISANNDSVTEALWAWPLVYIVHEGRIAAWHNNRTGFGTFSFEDWYRWHIDLMNLLFANSIWPSAPAGIQARVRLDRIIYVKDDVEKAAQQLVQPDGIRYDQGSWIWIDDDDKKKSWKEPAKDWRNQTEWSLPHELGHQLGLTDLYGLDYPGDEGHKWPDNGDKVGHFMSYPTQMMHWHGPQLFGELDAGYLNQSWDKPRGHFGDFYFAIPKENFLRITDINGEPLRGAKVSIFQRGAAVAAGAKWQEQQGAKWREILEDGNFDKPVSKESVIEGVTNNDGMMRLPNRPVQEVRTLNGFERKPNPFGNINVVGNRGLMLAQVNQKGEDTNPAFFWLEVYQFNVAYFRGDKERFTISLRTPFASLDSPKPPRNVIVQKSDNDRVKLSWDTPDTSGEPNYLDKFIGFRVYRRFTSDGLDTRPWVPIATTNSNARTLTIDLRDFPDDIYWNEKTNRFAVSSIGYNGKESALVSVVYK